jgi:hypothetical protein
MKSVVIFNANISFCSYPFFMASFELRANIKRKLVEKICKMLHVGL